MRIISETASDDLSGDTLFPNLYPQYGDFNTIRSSDEYFVSPLEVGTMTEAFRQVAEGEVQDVDTFVMQLDAGDTYQVVFSSAETEQFLSNRGMTVFGIDGSYVGLILNDHGNTFSPSGTLTSLTFTPKQSGDYLLFSQFSSWGGSVTASYGLTLEKVRDVTPWSISLGRNGMGAKAVVTSGDEIIRAGTAVTISLTFETSNITFNDVNMLVSGSMSTSISSSNNSTTLWMTFAPSQAVTLQELVEISFYGTGNAGTLEVSYGSVRVGGTSAIIDLGAPISTPGNMVLAGTAGNDLLTGDVGNDRLSGLAGDDTLVGNGGDDLLDGGLGADTMRGGAGNDTYLVDNVGDRVIELAGGGTDTVRAAISYALTDHVENLVLTGSANINGTGNARANQLTGNAGSNLLDGGLGADTMRGGAGNDTLLGGGGNDSLFGGAGRDQLTGGAGSDQLTGGAGKDRLTGGLGADHFMFTARTDSGAALVGRDVITDFSRAQGDIIDLSAIDANLRAAGDQAFRFLGANQFSGAAGELRYQHSNGSTLIFGDTDGDGRADFSVELTGQLNLLERDFLL